MPMEIDLTQRLASIAEATLELVSEGGIDAVSIRAVAKRIGGSTTLVTNYLPTREALLRNAVEHAMRAWGEDADQRIGAVAEKERLAFSVRWASTTASGDEVLRRLFMEILGRSGPDSEALGVLKEDSRRSRALLAVAATDAGAPDPRFAADIVFLALRGFYLSSLEDPEVWNSESVGPLLDRLVTLLTSG